MAEEDDTDLNEVLAEHALTDKVSAFIVKYDGGPPRLAFGKKRADGDYKFHKRLDLDAAAKLPEAIAAFKKAGKLT